MKCKKLIAILLILAFTMVLFSACNSNSTPDTSQLTPGNAQATEPIKTESNIPEDTSSPEKSPTEKMCIRDSHYPLWQYAGWLVYEPKQKKWRFWLAMIFTPPMYFFQSTGSYEKRILFHCWENAMLLLLIGSKILWQVKAPIAINWNESISIRKPYIYVFSLSYDNCLPLLSKNLTSNGLQSIAFVSKKGGLSTWASYG